VRFCPRASQAESKIIYLYRNPKDTVVSWYHFQRLNPLYEFTGGFDNFFDLFLADRVAYGSYGTNDFALKLAHFPPIFCSETLPDHASAPWG
jgi:hypothetical protein